MYRPTVRYSDVYRDHIKELFHATTLDRNQILRLALHVAAHSTQFNQILSKYKKGDVPLPSPKWKLDSHGLWFENSEETEEGGKDVNANLSREKKIERNIEAPRRVRGEKRKHRRQPQVEGRDGEIPTKRIIRNQGGIKITIG